MTRKDESLTPKETPNQEEAKSGVSRRRFLVAGTAVASALAMPGAAKAAGDGTGGGKTKQFLKRLKQKAREKAAKVIKWYNRFFEPKVFDAGTTGTVGTDLHVTMADVTIKIPNSDGSVTEITQTTRTYNDAVPGPTFRLHPGDALTFKVINELPNNTPAPDPYGSDDCKTLSAKNIPGCFNTTNLHTHGLHVSPSTQPGSSGNVMDADSVSSDDVHVRIPPANDTLDNEGWSSSRDYCVKLPDFHAPGTHWYHSHIHGATAIQVVNGLAGAIIVEEPDDQIIPVDDEKILIMQEIIGTQAGTSDTQIYANIQDSTGTRLYGSNPPSNTIAFTINSMNTPTIEVTTGEIQRWRFINATATPRGYMDLAIQNSGGQFVDGVMHLIAEDGITFYGQSPQAVVSPGHFMAPANRADFLVQFSQPGDYQLWKKTTNMQSFAPGAPGTGPTTNQVLAFIHVTGNPVVPPNPLPSLPGTDKAPCYLQPITDDEIVNDQQTFTFNVAGTFGQFTIDGNDGNGPQAYGQGLDSSGDPNPPPNYTVQLGSAEEWTLVNNSNAAHPFHIHVNPFQVLEVTDPSTGRSFGPVEPEDARWWDTFSIPPQGGTVKIRSRFPNYSGKFVFHCHILIHEDSGMMWDVTVDGAGAEPCEAVSQDQC